MKRLLTTETLENLMQIVIICIVAAFALTMLESCSEERLKIDEKQELKNMLPLCALNQAGEDDMNIVFLPEGYTADQMDVFMKEVVLAWKILCQAKPYSHSLDRINVYYSTALASASDTLGSGHTAFGLDTPQSHKAYCKITLDSVKNVMKRLLLPVEKTIMVVMANAGNDTHIGYTLVTTPSPRMSYPVTVVIRSLFCKDPAAFTHEMGHAVGLLADEYYYNDENLIFDEKESTKLANWQTDGVFLNVSASSEASEVFWHQFLTDDDFSEEKIGIYEGGDSYPHGVYRSTFNSVMRYHFQSEFYNAVDRYLVYRRIENMHSGRDISYEEWKQIDLAHHQYPIDWQSLTGGVTRSGVDNPVTDQFVSESDVVFIH